METTVRCDVCPSCRQQSSFFIGQHCGACVVSAYAPDMALAMRIRSLPVRPAFSPLGLAAHFRELAEQTDLPYYYSSFLSKYSIIKQCEQLRYLMLSRNSRITYEGQELGNNVLAGVNNQMHSRARTSYYHILSTLFTGYQGCCAVCGAGLELDSVAGDTVVPVHIDHRYSCAVY